MRRFHFRLERLLDIRKHKERKWELKLAAITGVCLKIKQQIDFKGREIRRSREDYAQKDLFVDLTLLKLSEEYIQRLGREITGLKEELILKEEQREKVKQDFIRVSRDRKVLERLKQKKEQEYYKEQRQAEFKEMDDINNSRKQRRITA